MVAEGTGVGEAVGVKVGVGVCVIVGVAGITVAVSVLVGSSATVGIGISDWQETSISSANNAIIKMKRFIVNIAICIKITGIMNSLLYRH
jgi:hypothetical protein